MTRTRYPAARRVALPVAAAATVVGLTGCGLVPTGGTAVVGGPMMGRTGTEPAAATGGAMMGGRSMMGGTLACTAPANLPGSLLTVSLIDMPMMGGGSDPAPLGVPMRLRASSTSLPAGQVNFIAENLGSRTHELVILPLAAGEQPGARAVGPDGTVPEAGSLGEASASCAAGSGEGITSRTAGWVTLTLAPGRYQLLCDEPNHYADGMWTELDVV